MALTRIGPGVYRDSKTGKTYNAPNAQSAAKMAKNSAGKGAKNEQTPTSDTPKKSKTETRLESDLEFGRRMATQYGLTNPFERLDATTPQGIQNLITSAQTAYDTAGNRSQQMANLLGTMEGGLGGLSAAENQGLRESGLENILRGFQGAQRAMMGQQAVSGVRGASAAARFDNLNRELIQGQRGLERDIMLENIAIQDARRKAYGELLQGVENDEFGRKNTAFGNLSGITTGNQARTDEINKFNIGQGERERSMATQGMLGFAGLLGAARDSDRAYGLARSSVGQPGAVLQTYGTGGGYADGYGAAMQELLRNTFPNEYNTITNGSNAGSGI